MTESKNKFLSDGRKVAVLGKLNDAEYIVQEIFVTQSGAEIPSGENFTAKSLHDTPVESYAKKEETRQKAYVEKAKAELESINMQIKEKHSLLLAKKDMLANSPELKGLFGEKARIIAMFMTGTVNYLVVDNYRITAPVKMEDRLIYWDNYYRESPYDGIKLCSILGKSGGDIEYRIHQYSDGSGSSSAEVYPFETLEEAKDKIHSIASEKIEKNCLAKEEYDICKSLGITFSQDELDKLELDGDCEVGDLLHMVCMAKVTSISKSENSCRIEMQIIDVEAMEDENNEFSEEEQAPRFKLRPENRYK